VKRVGTGSQGSYECVTCFVVRGVALFFVGQNHGLAFDAHEDFVLGHFEVGHGDELAVLARGPECGLVHQVGKIGAGKSWGTAGDHGKLDIFRQGNFARMHAKNFFAAFYVRPRNDYAAVEASGAEQSRIKHVGAVGGCDQDDAFVRFEAVHFDEQSVQRLFAFVVATA